MAVVNDLAAGLDALACGDLGGVSGSSNPLQIEGRAARCNSGSSNPLQIDWRVARCNSRAFNSARALGHPLPLTVLLHSSTTSRGT